ncbi:MAG: TonB-dependent receptor [Bacteroidia bacterium]|nr:TonB-dependent receptor [Bacteroidia bacterium]
MRLLLILSGIIVFLPQLTAQQLGDTALRTVSLQEVCIYDGADSSNIAFNFYQSGKLAGTEELLSRMSGVSLIRRGAFGMEPVLRNYSGGQINTTIDGMKIYGACTDRMDPVSIYIEPVNLHSIQAGHGVGAGSMGSTIGGQINFQIQEPDTSCHNKVSGNLSQSFATNNSAIQSAGWLQASGRKISARLAGAYRKAGNYHAAENVEIPWSGYEKANVSTVVLAQLSSSNRLRFDVIYDIGKNIGFPALPMDVGRASALIGSISHHYVNDKSKLQSINSRLYGNHIKHAMDDTHRDSVAMHMDMPGWSTTWGYYSEMKFSKGFQIRIDGHRVTTLADMTMYPKNAPIMYVQTLPENRIFNTGISGSKEIRLARRQIIRLSTRVDYYRIHAVQGPGVAQWEVFGQDITTKRQNVVKNLGVSWEKRFSGAWFSRVSAGYGERIPTAAELFGYYLFNRQDQSDYIGNYQLKPESSWQLEWLGRKDWQKGLMQLNLFAHHVQHLIYATKVVNAGPATPGALGLKSYSNIPFAWNIGFEFTGKYHLTPFADYLGTVKYLFTKANNGEPLPLVAPLKLQQAVVVRFSGFFVQAEHDFAASQNRVNVDYGDRRTAAFNLFNIRLAKNFSIQKTILQLSVACENIMDLGYREHLDIGAIPRPGRNFSFNLSYRF